MLPEEIHQILVGACESVFRDYLSDIERNVNEYYFKSGQNGSTGHLHLVSIRNIYTSAIDKMAESLFIKFKEIILIPYENCELDLIEVFNRQIESVNRHISKNQKYAIGLDIYFIEYELPHFCDKVKQKYHNNFTIYVHSLKIKSHHDSKTTTVFEGDVVIGNGGVIQKGNKNTNSPKEDETKPDWAAKWGVFIAAAALIVGVLALYPVYVEYKKHHPELSQPSTPSKVEETNLNKHVIFDSSNDSSVITPTVSDKTNNNIVSDVSSDNTLETTNILKLVDGFYAITQQTDDKNVYIGYDGNTTAKLKLFTSSTSLSTTTYNYFLLDVKSAKAIKNINLRIYSQAAVTLWYVDAYKNLYKNYYKCDGGLGIVIDQLYGSIIVVELRQDDDFNFSFKTK